MVEQTHARATLYKPRSTLRKGPLEMSRIYLRRSQHDEEVDKRACDTLSYSLFHREMHERHDAEGVNLDQGFAAVQLPRA